MPSTLSLNNKAIFTAFRGFILGLLDVSERHVVRGLGNRVSKPKGGFIAVTPILKAGLATNETVYVPPEDPTGEALPDDGPLFGTKQTKRSIRYDIQIDCYGPDADEWSTIIATMFRDEYGCRMLAPVMQPLHSTDPLQAPLTNAEQQYEQRWMITASVQINPVITTAMEFSDSVGIEVINATEIQEPDEQP